MEEAKNLVKEAVQEMRAQPSIKRKTYSVSKEDYELLQQIRKGTSQDEDCASLQKKRSKLLLEGLSNNTKEDERILLDEPLDGVFDFNNLPESDNDDLTGDISYSVAGPPTALGPVWLQKPKGRNPTQVIRITKEYTKRIKGM